jgi:hypothetical protein
MVHSGQAVAVLDRLIRIPTPVGPGLEFTLLFNQWTGLLHIARLSTERCRHRRSNEVNPPSSFPSVRHSHFGRTIRLAGIEAAQVP